MPLQRDVSGTIQYRLGGPIIGVRGLRTNGELEGSSHAPSVRCCFLSVPHNPDTLEMGLLRVPGMCPRLALLSLTSQMVYAVVPRKYDILRQ